MSSVSKGEEPRRPEADRSPGTSRGSSNDHATGQAVGSSRDAPVSRRRFHLDEDLLPGSEFTGLLPNDYGEAMPYLNHGRQVTRNRLGRWVCSFTTNRGRGRTSGVLPFASVPRAAGAPDAEPSGARHMAREAQWLMLAVSDEPCSQGSAFPDPIGLIGKNGADALFGYEGDWLGTSCVLMDDADRLHVFYEAASGIHYLASDASGEMPRRSLMDAGQWSPPRRVAPPGSLLGDAVVGGSGQCRVYYTRGGTLYERLIADGGGRDGPATRICADALHPTVHRDAAGVWHLAFERDRRVHYLRRPAGAGTWTDSCGRPEPELVAEFCSSWPSIASTPDGKVIIAYQGEGKAYLKRFPLLYRPLRDGGGTTVSYAVHDGLTWERHDLLRSSEIVLLRRPHHRNPPVDGTTTAHMEEFWRPSLTVDRHGVVWLLFVNTTRRHVYWSRFHGRTFGTHHEARGAYDAITRLLFLQKDAGGQDEIGYLTVASNQVYFDAITVPTYASTERRRVVFLDNLEADRMVGLDHRIGAWERHPEPVFGWGLNGRGLEDNPCWCQVSPCEGGFEMHYNGRGGALLTNAMPGRAFSRDGLVWEKRPPQFGPAQTLDGDPIDGYWRPVYREDPDEPDGQRRFKGLLARFRRDRGVEHRTWIVVASADGATWTTVDQPPVVVGDVSVQTQLLRDDEDPDPARRYKFIGVSGSHAGRAVVMFTSPDLIHWNKINALRQDPDDPLSPLCPYTTGPIAIDADGAEGPWEEEVHGAFAWREHGLLMLHYDAFYFGANQHVEKALAVSRDGRHYWRVGRGAINLRHGACGDWDSGRDRTSLPIRVGDELWLYFCGMPASYFGDPDVEGYAPPMWADGWTAQNQAGADVALRPWRTGLAKMRVDGWGYVELRRDSERGSLTTIPFAYAGGRLVVNGSRLGPAGVRVEVCVASACGDDDAVVPGFGRDACRFSAEDAVTSHVSWAGDTALPHGTYRLRFTFEGLRARLYSFGFVASGAHTKGAQ